MPINWLTAFIITLAIEMTVAGVFFRAPGNSRLRIILVAGLGTCITHPCLWFVLPHYISDYWTFIIVGELSVAVFEGCVLYAGLKRLPLKRAMAYSFLMNAASYAFGLILMLAWPQ